MSNFEKAISFVLASEGGYSNDSRDPGNWTGGKPGSGELKGTKYGISAGAYPDLDIKNITIEQAKDIYKKAYWNSIKGDLLPWPLNYLVFDFAVNSGINRAVKCLQSILGCMQDGYIGVNTLNKIALVKDINNLCHIYYDHRLIFLMGRPTWKVYGGGWSNRVKQVLVNAGI